MNGKELSQAIKTSAKNFGADIVGIADLKRWQNAPFGRTPQALMADSSAAIVLGIHYLDACVERISYKTAFAAARGLWDKSTILLLFLEALYGIHRVFKACKRRQTGSRSNGNLLPA